LFADVLILAFLVLVNGFFSCSELAIFSVNPNRIKLKADDGDKKAMLVKNTLENPDRFISTIQIAISLVGLFSGAYAGQAFAEPVVKLLLDWGVAASDLTLRNIVVFIITIVMSYFTLVLGELVPKKLALNNSEKVASFVIGPVNFLTKAFYPFVKLLSFSTNIVLKIIGSENSADVESATEEEIRMLVDAGSESGDIDEDEMEMINNVFEFDDKTAEDICTHRTDIVAVDADDPDEDIISLLMEMKYSRLPVYEENLDNIIGILHLKDFMRYLLQNNIDISAAGEVDFRALARDAHFVPTSKRSDELFSEMKRNKVHMSIVVDEYGGTVGLVSMEDLIEEVMGNIFDEYDDEEIPEIQALDSSTYEIMGITDLEDVAKALDITLPIDEYDTISGFLIGQLGRIPDEGETPEVEFDTVLFKVKLVEEKRIAVVIACKTA